MTPNGTRFNNPKLIADALIAAHKKGQDVAVKGLERLDAVLDIAQAIADKTGWAVGVIKDEHGLTHFMIIDHTKEPQP